MSDNRALKIAALLLIALFACGRSGDKASSPPAAASNEAPAFALKDPSGGTVSLGQFRGKVVLVEFWATWCAPCRDSIPSLVALHQEYSGKGFTVIGISIESDKGLPEKLVQFSRQHGINYPLLLDGEDTARSYGVRSIPAMLLIDKEGRIVETVVGYSETSKKTLRDKIEALL